MDLRPLIAKPLAKMRAQEAATTGDQSREPADPMFVRGYLGHQHCGQPEILRPRMLWCPALSRISSSARLRSPGRPTNRRLGHLSRGGQLIERCSASARQAMSVAAVAEIGRSLRTHAPLSLRRHTSKRSYDY